MSFDAGSIVGGLDWDISSFTRGMLQAESIAHLFPSVVGDFLADPMLGLVGVAELAWDGVKEAFKEGFEFIKGSFEQSQEMDERMHVLATNAGVAVETMSALSRVAEETGGNVDSVAETFKFLGRNAQEAQESQTKLAGSIAKDMREANDALSRGDFKKYQEKLADAGKEHLEGIGATFSQYGLSVTDASGKTRDLTDILFDLSDVLEKLPPGQERTRLAMELLGRSGSDMIATWSRGSDTLRQRMRVHEQMGAVVSEQAAKEAAAWKQTETEMESAWLGIRRTIGEPIREALTPAFEEVASFMRENAPQIRDQVKSAVDAVISAGQDAVNWTRANWPEIKADLLEMITIAENLGKTLKVTFDFATNPLGSTLDFLKNTTQTPGFLPGTQPAPQTVGPNYFSLSPDSSESKITREIQKKLREAARRMSIYENGTMQDIVKESLSG